MALKDALEIFDPEQFVEWKQSVEARILTEAGIEANVCKMNQPDKLLVSKIGGEYHTIPLHGCSNRYGLSKSVTTTFSTNGPAFRFAPNHASCGPLRSYQQEVQYGTPSCLIVQKGYDGPRLERFRLAACDLRDQGDDCVLDVKTA